jgi:hypothetical protein
LRQTGYRVHVENFHPHLIQEKIEQIESIQKQNSNNNIWRQYSYGLNQMNNKSLSSQINNNNNSNNVDGNRKRIKLADCYVKLGKREDNKTWCRCIIDNCYKEV